MGKTKSKMRKRSFWNYLGQDDVDDDLPVSLLEMLYKREADKFYVIKDIYIASQENAERGPPCSGER